jgi:hypothetical protein
VRRLAQGANYKQTNGNLLPVNSTVQSSLRKLRKDRRPLPSHNREGGRPSTPHGRSSVNYGDIERGHTRPTSAASGSEGLDTKKGIRSIRSGGMGGINSYGEVTLCQHGHTNARSSAGAARSAYRHRVSFVEVLQDVSCTRASDWAVVYSTAARRFCAIEAVTAGRRKQFPQNNAATINAASTEFRMSDQNSRITQQI